MHRYLARRVGGEAADDLAAEVFLAAFSQRHRYDAARECARPWLYGIATNLVGAHRRQEARYLRALARACCFWWPLPILVIPRSGTAAASSASGDRPGPAALAERTGERRTPAQSVPAGRAMRKPAPPLVPRGPRPSW